MLDDKVWLTVSVSLLPRGVGWGWGQGSMQASMVFLHQTGKTTGRAQGCCHIEQERAKHKLLPESWKQTTF